MIAQRSEWWVKIREYSDSWSLKKRQEKERGQRGDREQQEAVQWPKTWNVGGTTTREIEGVKKKKSGQCYHIVYNVFTMWHDQKEQGQGERGLKEAKHVHPKLPDYDQIAAHFTALRNQHRQKVP